MAKDTIKVLVVDDEPKIVEVLQSYLENSGYKAYPAYNGRQALTLFDQINPSLVVLDLMLGDISGEDICRILRKKSRVPIIMLTAKIEEEDILKGLEIGADDYVTKPFSPRQLVARVAALLRRTQEEGTLLNQILSYNNNDLMIDDTIHIVKKRGTEVSLTPSEYEILLTMIKYPRKVFTREELINLVIGDNFEGFNRTIDTHIKNIRQKIETDPKSPQYILTVHGVGYKFGGE